MNERTMAGHVLLTVAQSRRAYVGNLIVQKRLAEWIEEVDERERERGGGEGEERKKERRMWGDLEERENVVGATVGRFRRTGAPWVRG